MTHHLITVFLSVFVALSALTAAQPDQRDKEAQVTLTAPVEIRGVELPAGNYTFKFVDIGSDHQIVQIFAKGQNEPLTSFTAAPADDDSSEEDASADEDPAADSDIAADADPDSSLDVVVVPPPGDEEEDEPPCVPSPDSEPSR
jgi:hypothetical protein